MTDVCKEGKEDGADDESFNQINCNGVVANAFWDRSPSAIERTRSWACASGKAGQRKGQGQGGGQPPSSPGTDQEAEAAEDRPQPETGPKARVQKPDPAQQESRNGKPGRGIHRGIIEGTGRRS